VYKFNDLKERMDESLVEEAADQGNIENLFGDLGDDNERDILPPLSPLNPLEGVDLNATAQVAAAAKKRRVINRLPNLNEQYITTHLGQGLDKVNSYFDKVVYKKGKDSEFANLRIVLQQYEYYGQQCYPKLCFQDFTDKVEKLSKKKMIRNSLQDIRNRSKTKDGKEDEDEGANGGSGDEGVNEGATSPLHETDTNGTNDTRNLNTSENIENNTSENLQPTREETPCKTPPTVITEELKELMKEKRLAAIEKRKRKMEEFNNSTLNNSKLNDSNLNASVS